MEGFTIATSCDYTEGAEYLIQAANEYGGLSEAGKAVADSTDGIDVNHADESFLPTAIYTADGQRLKKPVKGLNIMAGSETMRKVLVR